MNVTKVTVHIRMASFLGTPGDAARGQVLFKLTSPDLVMGTTGGVVVPDSTPVPLDDNGNADVDLFVNSTGTQGTQYEATAVTKTGLVMGTWLATVPNAPCYFHEIVLSQPTPPLSDAQAAVIAAQAAVTQAEAAALTAAEQVAGEITLAVEAVIGTRASQTDFLAHTSNVANPHGTTAAQVGLGNVNNTSDANKPISTATATALAAKADAAATTTALAGKADAAATTTALAGKADAAATTTALAGKQASLGFTPENVANKGAANGYAGLDGTGKVPAAQLPAFVDDVLEFANLAAFPATGVAGNLYVALDTNKVYRWSGSTYIVIVASPGTTDAVPEGSVNLYFTVARVLGSILTGFSTASAAVVTAADTVLSALGKLQAQVSANLATLTGHTGNTANPHATTAAQVGLGNVDNTADVNKPVSTAQATAIAAKQDVLVSATNIKTINGNSLLGGGDIVISGGGGGTPAGASGDVQYNAAGAFGASPLNISITTGATVLAVPTGASATAGGSVTLTAGAGGLNANGGGVTITSGAGGATTGNSGAVNIASGGVTTAGTTGAVNIATGAGTSGSGGIDIRTGSPSASGTAGNITIVAGTGRQVGVAASVTIQGGNAVAATTAGGGSVNITGGNSSATGTSNSAGNIALTAGSSGGAFNGGNITLTAGTPTATGTGGNVSIFSGQGGLTTGPSGTITIQTGGVNSTGASGNIVIKPGGGAPDSGKVLLSNGMLATTGEVVDVSGVALTGAVNLDAATSCTQLRTINAAANWSINFRYSSTATLGAYLATGQSITYTLLAQQGASAFFPTAFTVDGTAVTPKWLGGSAPSAGNASSTDVYAFTIIKTGAGAYTVLASQTKYA